MISEEMLREAAVRSCDRYISHLLSGYDPEYRYEFSPNFEKKIRRLKRRADHSILYRTAQRIAVVLLALLAAGTVWLAVDGTARAAFFGWVGDILGNSYVYRLEAEEIGRVEQSEYRPAWLPEGYTEDSVSVFADKTTIYYTNVDGALLRFSYVQSPEERQWFLNITDTEIKDCQVNGQRAQLVLSGTEGTASAVTWTTADTAFLVTGFVTETELIRIAESVEKNE